MIWNWSGLGLLLKDYFYSYLGLRFYHLYALLVPWAGRINWILTQVSLSLRCYFCLSPNPPICCGAGMRYKPLRTSAWEAIVKCSYKVSKHLARLGFFALSMQEMKCLSHKINPLLTKLLLTMTSSSLSMKTQKQS